MPTSEPSVLVREAAPDDVSALAEISARAREATYRGMIPDQALDEWIATAHAGWREALSEPPSDSPARSWVAQRDGVVVGFATTAPAGDRWLPPPDGAGELTNLYLDPGVIGSGVGRALYDRAVSDLADRRFQPLVVWAFRDNARARRFYEGRGLVIDVPDHAWVLADVRCPIIRFRGDLAPGGTSRADRP